MEDMLFKEERIYSVEKPLLCNDTYTAIRTAIGQNQAVGFVAGYYDERLTIAYVSAFFLQNLGYSYEEFMAFTDGSLKKVICGENCAFAEKERFQNLHGEGEAQMLTKTGAMVHVCAYKTDTIDGRGTQLWVLSIHMDQMQENLKLVNKVLRSGFWSVDCDRNGNPESVHFSNEFRQMLGYADVLDFPNSLEVWDEALYPDDRKRVDEIFQAAFADKTNQTKYDVEYRMRMADGTYQWFRDSGEVSRRADGTAWRMAGIFVNIDKEKRKDASILELTQQNRIKDVLIQGTSRLVDRYAACDLKMDRYRFYSQDRNDAAYPPVGVYHEFVKAMAARFKTVSGDMTLEQAFSIEKIQKMLKTAEDIYRFEYCTKDETQFKSIAISPLSWEDGKVTAVLLMAQDTTAEKLVEIRARKALKEAYEAANKASHAKTEFLSNMSHDIRTPMNAIVGMTAIAGANIDNQERVIDCLGKITQSSRHLLSLVNEVLDMSRIESGRITLVEEEFNLSDLCDNLISMTKAQTDMHRHKFEVHINRIKHEDVCGDSMRIQQLLTNILSNAVKYTPDGGTIDLTISELPESSRDLGCYQFIVEDNGIGMTEEFQKIMFEPFTRADDMRTSKIQGTGLGMAIARNFAQMMNGDIQVKSAPGKGSRFTITIFLKLQNKRIDKIEELIHFPVLVVDDDAACCETTVTLLQEIGIDGEWVTSGEKAVEQIIDKYKQKDHYFAVIIDWKMPGMDGIETARQIRKKVGKDVTIIILSAYDYTGIEEEAREAGVDQFIAKPLFRSRLLAVLKNVIEGKEEGTAKNYLSDISRCNYTGKRILLVEDNDLNREIIQEILGMTGAEVVTADNGKTAVDMISSRSHGIFDLIFMDIQMPVMNGYQATAAIRALSMPEARNIPIIAMTANAFAEDVMLAKNAGMNEHISKPLDMARLRDVLTKWM